MPHEPQPQNIEPVLEAIVHNGTETNQLLETLIAQGEKNNPETALDALITSQQEMTKKLGGEGTGSVIADGHVINIKGVKGDAGHTPTPEELTALIQPLIPPPIAGHSPTSEELTALIMPLVPPPPSDAELTALIEPLIPEPVKGDKGHTPTVEELTTLIKPLIPAPIHGSPDNGADIITKIKGKLSYDDLIDRPNLETFHRGGGSNVAEFQVFKNGVLTANQVRAIDFIGTWTLTDLGGGKVSAQPPSSGGGLGTVYTETPTGAIDGVNKTYTTAHAITSILSFAINGQFIHPADYSVVGSTITFGTALDASLSGLPYTIIYA